MPFIPTSQCPTWPHYIRNPQPELLCPDLSDEEIDAAILEMVRKGEVLWKVPRTQYGRRAAVAFYLKGEQLGYDTR